MDNEYNVRFNFKAETSGIKAAAQEVKQTLDDVRQTSEALGQGFTVNWGEGTGSIAEYNEYLAQAKEEAAQATETFSDYSATIEQTATSTQQVAENTESANSTFSQLKDSVSNAKDALVGLNARLSENNEKNLAVQNGQQQLRLAFTVLAATVTAYAKASIKEYVKVNQEAANNQERLSEALRKLKATFGVVLAPILQIAAGIAEWAVENKELVTSITAGVAAFTAFAGAVKVVSAAIAVAKALTQGWLGILGLAVGVAAAAYVSTMDFGSALGYNIEEMNKLQGELDEVNAEIAEYRSRATSAGTDTVSQLRKIDSQLAKLRKNFLQSLKQIAVNHQSTLEDLTAQIEAENRDYQAAIDKRNAAFALSQLEEAKEHQEKVDELKNQIDFLQKYNNKYNQQKLEKLKFALAAEENLYKQQTALAEEELRIQNENDQKAHDEKMANLQADLDEELAFQNKHREALNEVRDIILQDEIENLQEQYNEQVKSYEEQKALAGFSGTAAGDAYSDAYMQALEAKKEELEKKKAEMLESTEIAKAKGSESGTSWATDLGTAMNDFLTTKGVFKEWWKKFGDQIYNISTAFSELAAGRPAEAAKYAKKFTDTAFGFASGGYTGQGAPDEVAGIVHKGEYVLPQEMVDQTTGTPKALGTTINNFTFNGIIGTKSELREAAEKIFNAKEQTNKSRLIA